MGSQERKEMNEVQLLGALLFSETKDLEDAKDIASVVGNRMARPNRFGETMEDVIYAPNQFSGVGSDEWNKAVNNKFVNKEEEDIYKSFLSVAHQFVTGQLEDSVDGADHYFNPKLANPSWAKKMKKMKENKFHSYYKE